MDYDYNPDPVIDAQIRAAAVDAEMADLKAGYPSRWWRCPVCFHEHRRGFYPLGALGSHRCLHCGYEGDRGTTHTHHPDFASEQWRVAVSPGARRPPE